MSEQGERYDAETGDACECSGECGARVCVERVVRATRDYDLERAVDAHAARAWGWAEACS